MARNNRRNPDPDDLDPDLEISMSPPETAQTPIPSSPPGANVGAWGPGAPLGIPNQPVTTDPSGTTSITQRPQTAFDRILPGSALSGHFDAWVGDVITTYPGGDPLFGDTNSISVRRVVVQWGTNNAPSSEEFPRAWSQPAIAPVIARPFPPRHDQPKYIAAGLDEETVGDIVTVITGTDGLHWYIRDELPFIGRVVKKESTVKEDTVGGAGLNSLKVRWHSMTGDPDGGSFDGATVSTTTKDSGGVAIDFEPVLVIKPDEQQHGYRCGDPIWVHRRGRYFFAEAAQEVFIAVIHETGPDSEADFANVNKYWVQEQSGTVTDYSGNNTYTLSLADRNLSGPDSGRERRWVQAIHIGESADAHNLAVDDTVTVLVHIFADPAGDPRGDPFYVFDHGMIGSADDPAVMLPSLFETEAAQADTWDRNNPPADKDGVSVRIQMRTAYDDTSDEILYAYYRTFIFDSAGALLTISTETRVTVDAPEVCLDTVTDEEYKSMLTFGGIV